MEDIVLEEQAETALEVTQAASDDLPSIDRDTDAVPDETPAEIDYAALAAEDLATLKAQFPALKNANSLAVLPDPVRYAELRECGLSPKEAYLATGGTPRKASDNRAHLFSAVPRASASASEPISASEMAEARRLFSDLSDAQIYKLHKKVSN